MSSDDLYEEFEERAAIMEYDGGFSRKEAERAAWECVHARYFLVEENMNHKSFYVKQLEGDGTGSAVFATLNVVDKDGDVTLPGAFGKQTAVVVPTHDWSSVPLGKGTTREAGDEAIVDFKLNLDSPTAKEWHSALKFDLDEGPRKQEWSYGFDILEESRGEFKGEQVRFLKSLRIHEVSPVLVGAGVNTRTLSMKEKGIKLSDQFQQVEHGLVETRAVLTRMKAILQMRRSDRKHPLSPEDRGRLEGLAKQLAEIQSDIEMLTKQPEPEPVIDGAALLAQYQRTLAQIQGHLSA